LGGVRKGRGKKMKGRKRKEKRGVCDLGEVASRR